MIPPAGNRFLPVTILLLLATTGWTAAPGGQAAAKPTHFRVGDITIDFDPRLQKNWDFSDFRRGAPSGGLTIEGVAVYHGGQPQLYRWYGYDKDGIKIDDGPLTYQDYPIGQKTRFEIRLADKSPQIKRIQLVSNAFANLLPPGP